MNCQELQRLVHAYLDYELDLMTSLEVEAHLKDCGACRARHAELRALRDLGERCLHSHAAPASLKARIERDLGPAAPARAASGLRTSRAAMAISLVALAIALGWTALPGVLPQSGHTAARAEEKIVYHLSTTAEVTSALRNVANHLSTSPRAKVVIVVHNNGIDFLMRGAKDSDGALYEAAVSRLISQGVDFRLCQNTLTRRQIEAALFLPQVRLVPSGVAEISRLQTQEGYAYMRL